MGGRSRRGLYAFIVFVFVASIAFRFAGRLLIHQDPLQKADAIVILSGARLHRTLEAGTLYREGWAPRIVVLRVPDLNSTGVLQRLGVSVPMTYDIQMMSLHQMGVPDNAITTLDEHELSTVGEAALMRDYTRDHGWKRIIVTTSPYHTGRSSWCFHRSETNVEAIIRASRYERVNAARWWRSPGDQVDVIFEYMKWPKAIVTAR